jgi:hypothetical protein
MHTISLSSFALHILSSPPHSHISTTFHFQGQRSLSLSCLLLVHFREWANGNWSAASWFSAVFLHQCKLLVNGLSVMLPVSYWFLVWHILRP